MIIRTFYRCINLLVSMTCALLLLTFAVSPMLAQPDAYQETACPFDVSSLLMDVRCGLLTVPENRQNPNSRPIVLAVMIAESPNPNKALDPIVYLAGGPGESAIASIVPILSTEQGGLLLEERDWIVIDQRGTGYSVPRLDCNIFGIARIASPTALIDASEVCWQRYAASGIDLSGYTTEENAADIEALRLALGYEAWNVFGVSYGTTLALTLMDVYPDGLRSVVLDSTLPPQRSFFLSDVENKLSTLQRVFDACRRNAACDEAYPDLEERFEGAVEMLNEQPLSFDGLSLSGDFLVFALTNTSVFQREVIEQLPAILDSALSGEFEALAQLLGGVASGSDAEGGYETDLVAANDGMGLAINCNRDARFPELREQLLAVQEQGASAAALAGLYLRYLDACAPWKTDPDAIAVPEPVVSDVPTLFFVGEWDPSTPLALAEQAAASLSNPTIVVFPGQGHSVLLSADNPCPAALLNNFVSNPDALLNTACVEDYYPLIEFVR
jgi:pimeloyl-ACP methyl ester carboxylesterase